MKKVTLIAALAMILFGFAAPTLAHAQGVDYAEFYASRLYMTKTGDDDPLIAQFVVLNFTHGLTGNEMDALIVEFTKSYLGGLDPDQPHPEKMVETLTWKEIDDGVVIEGLTKSGGNFTVVAVRQNRLFVFSAYGSVGDVNLEDMHKNVAKIIQYVPNHAPNSDATAIQTLSVMDTVFVGYDVTKEGGMGSPD